MRNILSILFVVFTAVSCTNIAVSNLLSVTRVNENALPDGPRSSAVSFVIGDTAYVTLGRKVHDTFAHDAFANDSAHGTECYVFFENENRWVLRTQFPGVGRVNAVANVIDDKAYVGLGYYPGKGVYVDTDKTYLRDFWMYDPTANTWARKADFPSLFSNKCIHFVYDDMLYVGFGFNGYSFNNEMWKYNPEADEWTKLKNAPLDGRAGAVASADSYKMFVGTGYATVNKPDWWEYEPEDDKWFRRKSMPCNGRVNAVGFTLGDNYFVATGRYFGGTLKTGTTKNDILMFDAENDKWTKINALRDGARENAVSFRLGDNVYIGLGENDSTVLNDFYLIQINENIEQ
jgi:N-acetylneuraminic acid mutarotase